MALPLIMQQLELNIIIPEQNPLGAVAIANPLLSYVFEEALHPAASLPIVKCLDGSTC